MSGEQPSRAFVLRPGEGRDIDLGNFKMSLKASGEETDQAFSLLEAEEPPNFGPPMHIHHDAAEAFYVISGEYIIFIGDEEHVCPAGSFIYIPASGEMDDESLGDMARRYGMEVIGPVPEGYV